MSLSADVEVIRGSLDLRVRIAAASGEVLAVLGPNGAGKSTLLRALAGLTPLRAGRIEVDGRVVEDPASGVRLAPEQRDVGVVFQDLLLFPHLSVRDNVAFGLRARGVRRTEAARRADDWLGRIGLAAEAAVRPVALSGGQAQRVALARALATAPRLLLLDEPLASLDVATRDIVRRELRRHLAEFPGPVVLVTHEPLEAIALADRLLVLESGRAVQEGPVAEIARRPRSAWAARLVGLNHYQGTAAAGALEVDGGGAIAIAGELSGPAMAVIHPRAVALHRDRPAGSPRNVWPGVVAGLDSRGERVRVQVDGAVPIVAEVTPAAVADLRLADGGEVWVSVKASEVDAFPA